MFSEMSITFENVSSTVIIEYLLLLFSYFNYYA